MDNNEIKNVDEVIALIHQGVNETETMVVHNRDGSTNWMDLDEDPIAKMALESARVVAIIGMLVLDNWDEMKCHFPDEVQEQVKDLIALWDAMGEQPDNNEE